ncbi:hypothetical protein, partial [Enterococcus faecalis]
MRNIWRLGAILFTIGALSACSNKNESSESTQASNEISLKSAENDAKTVLSYIYDGKVNGVEKVTGQTADENDDFLLSKLAEKQNDQFEANENDYYLIIDGSKYFAEDIVADYANAYLEKTKEIGYDSDIKVEELNKDEITIAATITPIAGLSEANPIGNA